MDEETRNEIEAVKGRISDLASCLRTLQVLAEQHREAIAIINGILEEEDK